MISIIMPVYNSEKYLARCINSVLNQTYKDFELIIVNDSSTDNSEKIIKDYLNDKRIKYFNNIHKGVSNARNLGIEKSKGEYITFIDSDDWMLENALEEMYKYINIDNIDVCISGYIERSLKSEKLIELPYKDGSIMNNYEIKNKIISKMIAIKKNDINKTLIMGSVWRLLIKSDLIKNNDIKFNVNIDIAEDLLFCIEIFSKAMSLITMKKCYYCYMRYGDTTLDKYRENFLDESLYFYSEYERILKEEDMFDDNLDRFIISKCSMYTNAISNNFRYNSPKELKIIKNELNKITNIYRNDKILKNTDKKNISFQKKILLLLIKYKMNNIIIILYLLKNNLKTI